MDEDAQIGLQLLSAELMMAGYAQAIGTVAEEPGKPRLLKAFESWPVWGCDRGFVSASTKGNVVCAATGQAAALEVRYQADFFNTIPTVSSKVPGDCLGNGLKPQVDGGSSYVTFNRYYLGSSLPGRSELHCASQLGNGGQPLVDDVEGLKFWFGEALAGDPRQVVRYVSASEVQDFSNVISVRICLLMRSAEAVLLIGEGTTYLDCDQSLQVAQDRRARRSYFSTVALRNKMPF